MPNLVPNAINNKLIVDLQMDQEVKTYFGQFGEVDIVRYYSNKGKAFSFGFVQFKATDSAEAALMQRQHRIAGRDVKVKIADVWHQPGYEPHPSLKAPEQNSPLHILNALNDDCLREIFKFLPLVALVNAADVCVRFRAHAKVAFASKFKNTVLTYGSQSHMCCANVSKEIIGSMLRNFGRLMQSIEVDGSTINSTNCTFFLNRVGHFCSSSVKKLILSYFKITGKLLKKLHPLFANLNELSLTQCEFNVHMTGLLAQCQNMTVFSMERCNIPSKGQLLKQQFAQLQEVNLKDNDSPRDSTFVEFFTLNPTITKLSLGDNFFEDPSTVVRAIGQHLRNLVELNLDSFELWVDSDYTKDVDYLGRLKCLKRLVVLLTHLPCTPLLRTLANGNVPIEHLSISDSKVDKSAIDQLVRLKHIKVLKLLDTDNFTDVHLINVAQELPLLQELCVGVDHEDFTTIGVKKMLKFANNLTLLKLKSNHTLTIDVDDFKSMVKTLQNRTNKQKLRIEMETNGDKLNVPEKVLQENSDWLCIDEQIEDTIDDDFYDDGSSLDDWSDYDSYHDYYLIWSRVHWRQHVLH